MGVIGKLIGGTDSVVALGSAARDVVEVFRPNATREMELSAEAQTQALRQMSEEFANAGASGFDRFVNGLNRLPRPMLALGTLGLFVFAMIDPESFGRRMTGLNLVPDPLWWLLAAIVGFYFGSREAHYFRSRPAAAPAGKASGKAPGGGPDKAHGATPAAARPAAAPSPEAAPARDANAALDDWRAVRG